MVSESERIPIKLFEGFMADFFAVINMVYCMNVARSWERRLRVGSHLRFIRCEILRDLKNRW